MYIAFIVSALLSVQLGCALPVPQDTALAVQNIGPTNSLNATILLNPQEIDTDTLKALDKAKLLLKNVLKDEAITAVHTDVMENYTKNLTAIVTLIDNLKCEPKSTQLCGIYPVFADFLYTMQGLNSTDVKHPSAELVLLDRTLNKYGVQELKNDMGSIYERIIARAMSVFFDFVGTVLQGKS